MRTRFLARLGLGLTLGAASLVGCRCTDNTVTVDPCKDVVNNQADHPGSCGSNADCADHFECQPVAEQKNLSCCLFADRKCNSEADCCPGQTCLTHRSPKVCGNKVFDCTRDEDCQPGQFCEEFTDPYNRCKAPPCVESRCRFKPCSPLGDCPVGQYCFQGECLVDLPCLGSCEPGKACVPSTGRCQGYGPPMQREEAACPVSCAPGHIATFADNTDLWDLCKLPAAKCVCAELPPLRSNDLGRHSALAVDPAASELVVSAYDGQYGDLVVLRYDAQGKLLRKDYVDGVPNGTVKYGPSGPRGGVEEPGDDVGRHSDVAVHGDHTYVSYYDVTRGDLKLAVRGADGKWSVMQVDGTSADLGLYTSVAVDSDGLPGISYFQRGGDSTFDPRTCPGTPPTGDKAFITALKFARATSPTPSAGGFTLRTLACQSRPIPPCHNCTQTCADPGTGPACLTADSACTPACDANTEVCVRVGTTPKCAKKYNPANLNDWTDGVGLFSSLAYSGKDAYVAYMRRTSTVPPGGSKAIPDGDLFGIRLSAQLTPGPAVLLDAEGDTGFFPDVKIDPGSRSVAVSFHDFSSKKLKFFYSSTFVPNLPIETIDTGLGAPGTGDFAWVGTDSALVFAGAPGQIFAVYQDATRGDLKVATRRIRWQTLSPLRTDGAVGFFADGAALGGKIYVSHASLQATCTRVPAPGLGCADEPKLNNALLIDQLSP